MIRSTAYETNKESPFLLTALNFVILNISINTTPSNKIYKKVRYLFESNFSITVKSSL